MIQIGALLSLRSQSPLKAQIDQVTKQRTNNSKSSHKVRRLCLIMIIISVHAFLSATFPLIIDTWKSCNLGARRSCALIRALDGYPAITNSCVCVCVCVCYACVTTTTTTISASRWIIYFPSFFYFSSTHEALAAFSQHTSAWNSFFFLVYFYGVGKREKKWFVSREFDVCVCVLCCVYVPRTYVCVCVCV